MTNVAKMKSSQSENTNQNVSIESVKSNGSYVPEIDLRYYCYGNFTTVRKIIESGRFFPVWITGLSGNGKTKMIEQACAYAGIDSNFWNGSIKKEEKKSYIENFAGKGREFIRVNFTVETDEDDLIGSLRLVDKNGVAVTEFHEGPVITALRRGAVLLLDEIDIGHTNKIMCLQSVLEGQGVLIKTTNEFVKPAPGFQVFATSNTKGRGCESGTFIGTNIMNGAFLDRFAITIHQTYPPDKIEFNILKRYFSEFHWGHRQTSDVTKEEINHAKEVMERLCKWAEAIRTTYDQGGIEEVITTRALINIIQGYAIFGDLKIAIELCCERFDNATKEGFLSTFQKLNGDIELKSTKKGT